MRIFKHLLPDMAKTTSGSFVQFAITLLTTPLMTRLFDPHAYAVFGIVHNAAVSLVGVGLLSLPSAYPLEKSPKKQQELFAVMWRIVWGLCGLAALGVGVMLLLERFQQGVKLPVEAIWMLPVLVLTLGVRHMVVAFATAQGYFGTQAIGQMREVVLARGGSIGMGAALGGNAVYILLSVAAGHLAMAGTILRRQRVDWRRLFNTAASVRRVLQRYRDFVWFSTASLQANTLALLGLQMIFALYFSASVAGHYILAVSIVVLPVTLIALVTSSVMYKHFIDLERKHPEQLARHLMAAIALYVVAGVLCLLPVYLFGPWLFALVFGHVWKEAGAIASVLSPAFMLMFATMGVQNIFRVTRRLKLQCLLEVLTSIIAVGTAWLYFRGLPWQEAVQILSFIWIGRNVVLLLACLWAAQAHAREKGNVCAS